MKEKFISFVKRYYLKLSELGLFILFFIIFQMNCLFQNYLHLSFLFLFLFGGVFAAETGVFVSVTRFFASETFADSSRQYAGSMRINVRLEISSKRDWMPTEVSIRCCFSIVPSKRRMCTQKSTISRTRRSSSPTVKPMSKQKSLSKSA